MTARAEQLELREISGPSAVGGGAQRFFDLLWLSARTEFKLSYHGTALGFMWSFARPLMLFAILLVVFTQVFRLGSEVKNYAPMLLLNILLFQFFAQTTEQAMGSVVQNETVVRKMQFPRLVIPLSVVITNIMQLGFSLVIVFIFMIAYGVEPIWTWVLFPIALVALIALATSVAMLLSVAFVRVRDIGIIWVVGLSAIFYGCPVLYPIEFAPQKFQDIIALNPLTPMFEQVREWVLDSNAPGAVEAAHGNPLLIAIPLVLGLLICAAGPIVFSRMAPRIAEQL